MRNRIVHTDISIAPEGNTNVERRKLDHLGIAVINLQGPDQWSCRLFPLGLERDIMEFNLLIRT